MVPKWVYGTAMAVTLVQLATLYLHRTRVARGSGSSERADGATVECSECGAENESGYRFCRVCVSELPGTTARTHADGAARIGKFT